MKLTKKNKAQHLSIIRDALTSISIEDGIDEVDTFDRKLATKLRTVTGAARDALTYMDSRSSTESR